MEYKGGNGEDYGRDLTVKIHSDMLLALARETQELRADLDYIIKFGEAKFKRRIMRIWFSQANERFARIEAMLKKLNITEG